MPTRRDFIRQTALGASALAGLTAFAAPSTPMPDGIPRRFVFIRKSNGLRPHEVALPSLAGPEKDAEQKKQAFEVSLDKHELPAWMRPLEPHRQHLGILQGLSAKMSENGHYSYSSVMGAFKSSRNSLSGIKRATVDFELAKLFPSPFGHVELSLTGNYSSFRTGIVSGYSAPGAHQRNYCYADPQTAFNELFKSVTSRGAVESENSMLDFLQREESFKAGVLRGYEKLKLDGHVGALQSVRTRNQNLTTMADSIARHIPVIGKVHSSGGPTATTPEKQAAFTDILIAALAAGLTNVVTYTIDELSTPIKGLPGNEGDLISIHEIGHGGGFGGVSADRIREKIRIGHLEQVARIVSRLKEIPEGKGTLFDYTTILYFPENAESHHSLGIEAPYLVLSGAHCRLNTAGRYVRLPFHGEEGHKTIGNWYTTLLNAHGNPIPHYGDLDIEMERKKLKQTGAIQRLIA